MNNIKTIEVDGKTIRVYVDEDPINPRDNSWNDNLDMMICFHRKHNLGDTHNYKASDFFDSDDIESQLIKDYNPIVIKRLYLYDHSGLTISTAPFSCRWDSMLVGFILISRENVLKNWNISKFTNNRYLAKKADAYIEASVKEYDQFLRGDIYGYVISDDEGNELDSCWGLYGLDYAIEQAQEAAENCRIPEKIDERQLVFSF